MTPEERQELILEVIAKNPKITQNKLLDIVCNQLDGMAKVTFEKTLKKISSNGLVDMENDGNKYCYYLPTSTYPDKAIIQIIQMMLEEINEITIKIKHNYNRFPKIKKVTVLVHLIEALKDLYGCIIFQSTVYKYPEIQKQRRTCESLFQRNIDFINDVLDEPSKHLAFSFLRNQFAISQNELKSFHEEKNYKKYSKNQ